MVCWWGVGWEVNSLTFDRPRVSVLNFSFLACLEVAEKFVVGGGGWVVVVGGVQTYFSVQLKPKPS